MNKSELIPAFSEWWKKCVGKGIKDYKDTDEYFAATGSAFSAFCGGWIAANER